MILRTSDMLIAPAKSGVKRSLSRSPVARWRDVAVLLCQKWHLCAISEVSVDDRQTKGVLKVSHGREPHFPGKRSWRIPALVFGVKPRFIAVYEVNL